MWNGADAPRFTSFFPLVLVCYCPDEIRCSRIGDGGNLVELRRSGVPKEAFQFAEGVERAAGSTAGGKQLALCEPINGDGTDAKGGGSFYSGECQLNLASCGCI